MAVIQIDQMRVEEKLRAMESCWGDLCRREENLPTVQWHKDLLDEGEPLVLGGKARFDDWETAKRRITAQTS